MQLSKTKRRKFTKAESSSLPFKGFKVLFNAANATHPMAYLINFNSFNLESVFVIALDVLQSESFV